MPSQRAAGMAQAEGTTWRAWEKRRGSRECECEVNKAQHINVHIEAVAL